MQSLSKSQCLFCRNRKIKKKKRKIYPIIHMEPQGTPNSQSNLEKEKTKLKGSHFLTSKPTRKLQ